MRNSNLIHCYNGHSFVGGVSNGLVGAATMIYQRPTIALKAKKSWFFFDDLILCVGSGITISSENVTKQYVSTTITQVRMIFILT